MNAKLLVNAVPVNEVLLDISEYATYRDLGDNMFSFNALYVGGGGLGVLHFMKPR